MSTIIVAFVLGILSSLVATWIYAWIDNRRNMPWSGWKKRSFRPGIKGAKDLERLVKLLGEIHLWLGHNDHKSMQDSLDSLWRVTVKLSIAQLSYIAVYSQDTDEQLYALRRLSQINDNARIEAIQAIIHNPHALQIVVTEAEHLLREIRTNQISTNVISTNSGDSSTTSVAGTVHSDETGSGPQQTGQG